MSKKISILLSLIVLIILIIVGIFVIQSTLKKNRLEANIARCTDLGIKKSKDESTESNGRLNYKIILKSEYHYSKKLNTCVYLNENRTLGGFNGEIIDLYTNERLGSYYMPPQQELVTQENINQQKYFYSTWMESF